MALSSAGIGSNLPIDSIIEQLMKVESKPLQVLSTKESSYQSKLSAYGALSSALSSFQSTAAGLSSLSQFQQLRSTTTDATIASATAGASAAPGQYEVEVIQRAQAQSLSTRGQASTTSAIGTGGSTTLTFQFGTIEGAAPVDGLYSGASFTQDANQSSGTITIDSSNNSLQGIRDAINKAGIGVTATIVADGSAAPNRLLLTSSKTGAASSMQITVEGDASLQTLLTYDPAGTQNLTQNTVAQDALLKINGMDIKSVSNTVSGAIDGLTLTAGKIGQTSIAVTRDTAAIETAVTAFVKSFNELHGTLKYQTGYNADTKTGGPLVGDATTRTIQAALLRMFSSQPDSLGGGLTNLSQIGISFQKDGTLALDAAKLKDAIASSPADIGKLFATAGTPTDSLVRFVDSSTATKPGDNGLVITAIASKGQIVGSAAANTTIEAGVNDELTLTIDGITSSFKLSTGSYNAISLAAHLQATINGTSAFSKEGAAVSVSEKNGVLTITSNRYGSASKVALSGNGASSLLGASPVITEGVDVAGTINGIVATGSGQFLSGVAGSSTEGLKLQVTGGSLGARGNVAFSRGYASQLNTLIGTFLGNDGLIAGRTDGINRSIKDIDNQRDTMNARLTATEARYRKQYTALDMLISGMNTTSNYLTQQLASLANLSKQ